MVLPSRIAREVAGALNAKLTAQNVARFTAARAVDPKASDAYFQARQFLVKYKFKEAEDCYRRAIAIDSTFAAAWAGLANTYATAVLYGKMTPAQAAPLADVAIMKAFKLDEQLAETLAALGTIREKFEWNWSGADDATKRAVELNPNSIEVLMQRRQFLYDANRGEEAIEFQRRICELQPNDPSIIADMGWTYFYARHYDDAIAQFRKSDAMAGQRGRPDCMVAMCYYMTGRHKQALAECDANPHPGVQEIFIYASLGRRDERFAALAEKWKGLDMLNAALGNKDAAFAALRAKIESRHPEALQIPTEPYFDDMHSDPRWQELLDLIHYPKSGP
jgi:tetratricopeptide (TPR) repeat protein